MRLGGEGGMVSRSKGSTLLELSLCVWEIHQDGPLYKQEASSHPLSLGTGWGISDLCRCSILP